MDIWLTADDHLVVIHGGDDGSFHEIPPQEDISDDTGTTLEGQSAQSDEGEVRLISEMTLEETRALFRGSKVYDDNLKILEEAGESDQKLVDIPTLEQVFDLLADTSIIINVEAKTPTLGSFHNGERFAPRM